MQQVEEAFQINLKTCELLQLVIKKISFRNLVVILSGVRFVGMRTFVFIFVVVVFRFLLIRDLLCPALTCFLIVFYCFFQDLFRRFLPGCYI